MARTLFQHIEAIDKMFTTIPFKAYLIVAGFIVLMIGAMVQQRMTYEETFPSDLNISLDDDYSTSDSQVEVLNLSYPTTGYITTKHAEVLSNIVP